MSRLAEALKWAAAEGKSPAAAKDPRSDEAAFATAWDLEPAVEPAEPAVVHAPPGEVPFHEAVPVPATGTASIRLESQLAMSWPQPFPPEIAEKLVVTRGTNAAAVRAYRDLAEALCRRQRAAGPRSIVVTSAAAGEGKTLTAVNLALTLSQVAGSMVLLVDAHLARPAVHDIFRVSSGPGLRGCLRSPGLELPVVGVTANLFVLAAGREDLASPAVLEERALRDVLGRALERFDWVVLDAPPTLSSPDAALLASLATDVLLVVLAGKTRTETIRQATQALGPARLTGTVMNRA